jgi:hypothetical protein
MTLLNKIFAGLQQDSFASPVRPAIGPVTTTRNTTTGKTKLLKG